MIHVNKHLGQLPHHTSVLLPALQLLKWLKYGTHKANCCAICSSLKGRKKLKY